MALEELNHGEFQGIISQLKEALHSHFQWRKTLIRALVCKLPFDNHDISGAAHKECLFGQWYYSKSPGKLSRHPGFIAIGEEHHRLHDQAKKLLLEMSEGKTVSVLDYDNLANAIERLELEMAALERELEDAFYNHDPLTGAITRLNVLPTLRAQQDLTKREVENCYIVMMDLDNFKTINDVYGHAAGDRVLTAAVRFLRKNLRPYDKIFRYGGEEFLISMPYKEMPSDDKEDLISGKDRLQNLCDGLAKLDIDIDKEKPLRITASFGLALLDPEIPVEKSIERADLALYAAKSTGKNCVRSWVPDMRMPTNSLH